jgi:glucose/arabinose dehydrogenase
MNGGNIMTSLNPQASHRVGLAAALLALSSLASAAPVNLRSVVEGLERPVAAAHAGDGSGRLFIVQQGGEILIFDGTKLLPDPFLDLSSSVSSGSEQGLLGLAFHPNYENNGFFYVNYTDVSGDTQIVRFTVSADPNVANPGSAVTLLSVDQPFANHNGGQLAFGPDGKLWIGLGDGGSAGDPGNRAQSGTTLLGKILRIDVDQGVPYGIPQDNPFVSNPAVLDEIWALGLRNPWRFTFDRLTGDLFIADVGQNLWEEVNFEPVTSAGGANYGWRRMEGAHCFNPASNCNTGSLILPILEYSHSLGCSITGGYRYRGTEMPEHFGTYFFGDYCSGSIWGGIENVDTGAWSQTELLDSDLAISTFGEDEQGELYVADHNGTLYRMHGETFCNVQLDRSRYASGDTVRATVLEIANLSTDSVAIELKIWLEVPDVPPIPVSRAGADGSLLFPANFSVDNGPVDLFTVSGATPPGNYVFGCRFIDPATGALVAEDLSTFVVE